MIQKQYEDNFKLLTQYINAGYTYCDKDNWSIDIESTCSERCFLQHHQTDCMGWKIFQYRDGKREPACYCGISDRFKKPEINVYSILKEFSII